MENSENKNTYTSKEFRKNNKLIYPHVNDFKQKKSTSFIFCYHAHVVDYRNLNDLRFSRFLKELLAFITKTDNEKLVGPEEVYNTKTTNIRKNFFRTDGERSCFWEFSYISREHKETIDNYLIDVKINFKIRQDIIYHWIILLIFMKDVLMKIKYF